MLRKRIIPCLDVKDSKVVKGKNFAGLQYAGDALALAKKYYLQGADELVFLDIAASSEKRKTLIGLVEKISREIFIPFSVGGGIGDVEGGRGVTCRAYVRPSQHDDVAIKPIQPRCGPQGVVVGGAGGSSVNIERGSIGESSATCSN